MVEVDVPFDITLRRADYDYPFIYEPHRPMPDAPEQQRDQFGLSVAADALPDILQKRGVIVRWKPNYPTGYPRSPLPNIGKGRDHLIIKHGGRPEMDHEQGWEKLDDLLAEARARNLRPDFVVFKDRDIRITGRAQSYSPKAREMLRLRPDALRPVIKKITILA